MYGNMLQFSADLKCLPMVSTSVCLSYVNFSMICISEADSHYEKDVFDDLVIISPALRSKNVPSHPLMRTRACHCSYCNSLPNTIITRLEIMADLEDETDSQAIELSKATVEPQKIKGRKGNLRMATGGAPPVARKMELSTS